MTHRRHRTMLIVILLFASVVAVTGCTAMAPHLKPSSSSSDDAPPVRGYGLREPECTATDLQGEVDPGPEAAAGHLDDYLSLTNTSRRACTVTGVPRVWFVDSQGKTIGAGSAASADGIRQTITAQPGGAVRALLDVIVDVPTPASSCGPVTPRGFRLGLPDGTSGIVLPFAADGVASTITWACSLPHVLLLTAGRFVPTT